jgi:anti-sigma regulatory factor (Ser/Thr protein kinase)
VPAESREVTESRDVALTIPARPEHLVLARLALSAVCRLTPLSHDEIADLKLAITEAANDFVDDSRPDEDEGRVNFAFRLYEDRLVLELDGPEAEVSSMEQELGRAIIDATVDECAFEGERTRLVKYLGTG